MKGTHDMTLHHFHLHSRLLDHKRIVWKCTCFHSYRKTRFLCYKDDRLEIREKRTLLSESSLVDQQ